MILEWIWFWMKIAATATILCLIGGILITLVHGNKDDE
jgi:hypothetical protein